MHSFELFIFFTYRRIVVKATLSRADAAIYATAYATAHVSIIFSIFYKSRQPALVVGR